MDNLNTTIKRSKLAKFAVTINFLSVAGFFLTLFFQIVLAKEFGISVFTDAYVGASTVPLIFVAMTSSLLEKVFIPLYFKHKKYSQYSYIQVNSFISLYIIFLLIVMSIGYVISPHLIKSTLPGFESTEYIMACNIFSIILPIVIFGGMIGLFNSLYYIENKFIIPNIAPSLKWITAILTIVIFKNKLGIFSVAFGILLGYIVQFSLLLSRLPIRFKFNFNFRNSFVVNILISIWPLLIAQIFNNITIILMRRSASLLGKGSISSLDYAYKIITVSVFLCIQGAAIVLFPLFSKYSSEGKMKALKKVFMFSERVIVILIVPIFICLIGLRQPIVRFLFERGMFSADDTFKTSTLLLGFCGAFLALSIGTIQSQIYYALRKGKRILFISIIQTTMFVILVFIMKDRIDLLKIAMSFSIAIFLGCAINHFHINKKLNIRLKDGNNIFGLKILIGAFLSGLGLYLTFNYLNTTNMGIFLKLVLSTIVLFTIYFILLYSLFRVTELKTAINLLFFKNYEKFEKN